MHRLDVNFSVFPNPVANFLNIAGNQTLQKEIAITSIDGKSIFESTTTSSIISLSHLESGIYIVIVRYWDGGSRQIKVIKRVENRDLVLVNLARVSQ